MPEKVHLDFELCGTLDLRDVGADVWVNHQDTKLIVVGYALDDEPAVSVEWKGDLLPIYPLWKAVCQGAEIHAWNAAFERLVWNRFLAPSGSYKPPLEQYHCTMAAAANAGLPLNLDDAAVALNTPTTKDKIGYLLMRRMARPRAFEPDGTPRWWHLEDATKLATLKAYNLTDVEAEREVSKRVPWLTQRERAIWLCDQRMNERGMPVDWKLLTALSEITVRELRDLNTRIQHATQGEVTNVTQNARLLAWLKARGYPHDSLKKDVLDAFCEKGWLLQSVEADEAIRIRMEAAKTSTAKLTAIANYAQIGDRARGLVQYGGAVRTLRWAGRGPQIQNFPRPDKKIPLDQVIPAILQGCSNDQIRVFFGRPLDVVSSCLRGVFQAPPGMCFVVCDYHAIEAVVLAWLAGFDDLLDVFRRGEDVYIHTANSIGSSDRTLGKVLRLACGYGMGGEKFQKTAAQYGLDLTLSAAHLAVQAFRGTNLPITGLWTAFESMAKSAIHKPGQRCPARKITFRMAKPDAWLAGSLLMEKPAGGWLTYRNAQIEDGRIVFDGVNQVTRQWGKQDTYGGKLVENATQSVARDLLADAMVKFEGAYPDALLTTVHDEIVGLVPVELAEQALKDLRGIMSTPPGWASGMPLSAAGYIADRYAKA